MAQTIEVRVPDIGDFKEVEVIELLVKPGDTVAVDQSLITVESDKASMEIPSSAAGVIGELRVKVGDKVSEGSVLLTLQAEAGAAAGQGAPAPAPAPAAPAPAPAAGPPPAGEIVRQPSSPAQTAPAGGSEVVVAVPDIGDFKEVEVIELLVKPGDTVAVDQSLITVESDKASMEIPSSAAGVIGELRVKVGDKVSEGSPVATLRGAGPGAGATAAAPAGAAPASAPAPAPASLQYAASGPQPTDSAVAASVQAAQPAAQPAAAASAPAAGGRTDATALPHASPSVRKFARELGVDLARVQGTGPKQRITQDDVRGFVKRAVAAAAAPAAAPAAAGDGGAGLGLIPWPKVDFAKFGPIEEKPLSRIKKLSGANLHRNWVMIPHVTNHDDADVTELEAFRVQLNKEAEKSGTKLTMLAFLVKACVSALQKFPEFNASLDGDRLVLKRYWHIGVAADTPNGLVVPVIRDADRKGLVDIAREMSELAAKARDGKLSPAEMQGGTFSISSLGGIGGTYFTPIINAPEVSILGVCRSAQRPVWDDRQGTFAPRLILPMSLSWDHRVIDGAAAARFLAHLGRILGDFRRVML